MGQLNRIQWISTGNIFPIGNFLINFKGISAVISQQDVSSTHCKTDLLCNTTFFGQIITTSLRQSGFINGLPFQSDKQCTSRWFSCVETTSANMHDLFGRWKYIRTIYKFMCYSV